MNFGIDKFGITKYNEFNSDTTGCAKIASNQNIIWRGISMNKERIKGIAIGFILCAILSAGAMVMASTQTVVREITYGVGVVLNGQAVQFDYDSRPFVMGGTTFLPLRTLAELLDLPVDFDPATNTVFVGNRHAGQRRPLNEVAPFFDSGGGTHARVQAEGTVTMGGMDYQNALTYWRSGRNISPRGTVTPFSLHNRNGQFRMLTGYVGRVDGTNMRSATMTIFGDDRVLATYEIQARDLPIPISVFVEGVQNLRIEFALDLNPGNFGVEEMMYALVAFLE
jgi:hypothetical protein